jgi:hypothetical protein
MLQYAQLQLMTLKHLKILLNRGCQRRFEYETEVNWKLKIHRLSAQDVGHMAIIEHAKEENEVTELNALINIHDVLP